MICRNVSQISASQKMRPVQIPDSTSIIAYNWSQYLRILKELSGFLYKMVDILQKEGILWSLFLLVQVTMNQNWLGNGLVPSRQQAISWTNDNPFLGEYKLRAGSHTPKRATCHVSIRKLHNHEAHNAYNNCSYFPIAWKCSVLFQCYSLKCCCTCICIRCV